MVYAYIQGKPLANGGKPDTYRHLGAELVFHRGRPVLLQHLPRELKHVILDLRVPGLSSRMCPSLILRLLLGSADILQMREAPPMLAWYLLVRALWLSMCGLVILSQWLPFVDRLADHGKLKAASRPAFRGPPILRRILDRMMVSGPRRRHVRLYG
jgi:hypothetical protein